MDSPETNAALAAGTATVDPLRADAAATADPLRADTAATVHRIRELLTRIRLEPEPASGWVMRQERASPLDTRYAAR